MSKAFFGVSNLIDGGGVTLSSASETGTLPLANLRIPTIAKVARMASATPVLDIDFGKAAAWDVLVLAMVNDGPLLAPTDTWRVQAGTTMGGSDVLDTGSIACGMVEDIGYAVYLAAASVTARYLRISTASAGLAYQDWGRLWVGTKTAVALNPSYGFGERWVEGTTPISEGETSLVRFGSEGVHARAYSPTFEHSPDAPLFRALQRKKGTVGQFLFCLDPDDAREKTILCTMAQINPVTWSSHGRFGASMTLIESR